MSDRTDLTKGLVTAAIARGDSYARKGKYRRAIRIWRKLLVQDDAEAQLAKALIRGKIGATYFHLSRLALRGKPSRRAWLKAAERLRAALKYQDLADYRIELARSYWKLGQLAKADETLAELVDPAAPGHSPPPGDAARAESATPLAGGVAFDNRRRPGGTAGTVDSTTPGDAPVARDAVAPDKALYYAAVVKVCLGDLEAARLLVERGLAAASPGRQGWWRRLDALCTALGGDGAKAIERAHPPWPGVPREVWFEDVKCIARAATPSRELFKALDAILDTLEESESKVWAGEIGAMVGDLLAHLGEDEKAVQYWTDAVDGEAGRPLLEKVAATCRHRVVQAVKEGALDEAAHWYRIGVDSGVEAALKPLEGLIHFHRAQRAWKRADYRDAATGFAACQRLQPSFETARFLALSYEACRDWAAAAAAWQSAHELAPPTRPAARAEALRRQGLAWILAGSWEKARDPLGRALAVEPDREVAMEVALFLGCVLLALGAYGEAATQLAKAAGEGNASPRLLIAVACAVDLAQRPLTERVAAWKRAARRCQEAWVYRMWRRRLLEQGDACLADGRPDDALACYINLLIEDLDDRECWVRCGAVHLKEGRTQKAERCFAEARRGGVDRMESLIEAIVRRPEDPVAALEQWRSRADPGGDADVRRELVRWARDQLNLPGTLDPAEHESVLLGNLPFPATAPPAVAAFSKPLPIQRLLAREPQWSPAVE